MAGETLEVTNPPSAEAPAESPAEAQAAEQTPEEIEEQLRVTQQALAGKLGVLEEQTLGSIRETVGAVNDAVSTVQSVVANPMEAVQGAVQTAVLDPIENVTEEVTTTVGNLVREFDPSAVVRERPLESVGAAVLGGVVVGLILFGRPSASAAAKPGLLSGLTTTLSGEVAKFGRELIGTLSRSMVERAKSAIQASGRTRNGYSV
jgi:hypothetical protein